MEVRSKDDSNDVIMTTGERLFHTRAVVTGNVPSPIVERRVLGMTNSVVGADRSHHLESARDARWSGTAGVN